VENSSIAIISCDHGLGHIRRCLLWGIELGKRNNITVLAPKSSTHKIKRAIPSTRNVPTSSFATRTDPALFTKSPEEILSWLSFLPDLAEYDYVICDNLPEILLVRPDAQLSAQFFWHEVLPDVNHEYRVLCDHLLSRNAPLIYGCSLFTMPEIKCRKNFLSRDMLYSAELLELQNSRSRCTKDSLLISGGSTMVLRSSLALIVEYFVENGPRPFKEILVDESLLPPNPPPWIRQADFSPIMYMKLISAICRPGLGTISDLVCARVFMFLLHEPNNLELEYNTKVVTERGLGIKFDSVQHVISVATSMGYE